MTKSQSSQAFNSASGQNATAAANAQSTYQAANQDIGDYQSQLAQFASQNPFTSGGEYQTAQNQGLASTAAAGSQATKQAAQSAAVRSGLNPAAAIAAGEQAGEANTRAQMAGVGAANQQRIGQEAGYNQDVLSASAVPEQMEAGLDGQQLGEEQGALGTENSAAQTPSFWQELGQGVIGAGESFAGAYGKAAGGCWIAARLYGGWDDDRTKLLRRWIFGPFADAWYGTLPAAAYTRWGERIAERWMPKSRMLAWALRKLFDAALRRARAWESAEAAVTRFRAMTEREVL